MTEKEWGREEDASSAALERRSMDGGDHKPNGSAAHEFPWKNPKPQPVAVDPEPSDETVGFLKRLRPNGPWVLSAIVPDGHTMTQSFSDPAEAITFVQRHIGNKNNLYYSINPTYKALLSKAGKNHISYIEFIHSDLDPHDGETPEAAKKRYLAAIAAYPLKAAFTVDSGNGIQCLWRLKQRIELPPVSSAERKAIIEDVEARTLGITLALGGTAGTQNIDRILRLPGTTNFPNKVKLAKKRVACPTKLISFEDHVCELSDFPRSEKRKEKTNKGSGGDVPRHLLQMLHFPNLGAGQRHGEYQDRNSMLAGFIRLALDAKASEDNIVLALIDAKYKGCALYEHCHEQSEDALDYVRRQIEKLRELSPPRKGSLVHRASDLKPQAKDWLWKGHLLRGAQELLTGVPGLGKSQAQISLIACVSSGLDWPDGQPGCEPMNVIMLTAEDSIRQEVLPRLIAAGADRNKVYILNRIKSDGKDRQFLLAEDLDEMERLAKEIGGVGLITVDPITAYMGKLDSHKATDVRSQLGPLKDFAEKTDIAISSITHPPKSGGQKAIDQFIGSQAFIAAGRIGHICVEEFEFSDDGEKEATGRVLFANPKNNAHPRMPTLVYYVVQVEACHDPETGEPIVAPKVVWDGVKEGVTADEAVADQNRQTKPRKKEEAAEVQKFLINILRDGDGRVETNVLVNVAAARGFTKAQLINAKKRLRKDRVLNICARKEENVKDGKWGWQIEENWQKTDEKGEED